MKAIVLYILFVFWSLSAVAQSGTVYDQMRKLQSILSFLCLRTTNVII